MSALTRRKQSIVPPGFRFHPTDEELVGYYLFRKVSGESMDVDVIQEIDLYNFEPWDLEDKCRNTEENDMYFFSHMNKKYPTGTRNNRATTSGFWKATGKHKFIYTKNSVTGMRKTLVFYRGRAPKGQKTEWIIHEYRLKDVNINTTGDAWAVCRLFTQRRTKKRAVNCDTFSCSEEEIEVTLSPSPDSPTQSTLQNGLHDEYPLTCEQQINLEPHKEQEHLFLKLPELESLQCNYKHASASKNSAQSSPGNNMNEQNINEYTIEFEMNNVYDHPHETSIQQQHSILHEEGETSEWSMLVVEELTHEERIKEHRSLAYANSTDHESSGDSSLANRLSMMEQNLADVLSSCDNIDVLWSFEKQINAL